MSARVDDSIHIQVKVIHLLSIWIRGRAIDWDSLAVNLSWEILDDGGYYLGVLLRKPSEHSRDTHDGERGRRGLRNGLDWVFNGRIGIGGSQLLSVKGKKISTNWKMLYKTIGIHGSWMLALVERSRVWHENEALEDVAIQRRWQD